MARQHRGQWFTVPKLSGFCLLMKRAVYEAIGGLDERFGLGFFDDDDLAERARRAGFELAVAHDLFVHHFGSRTFAGNGIDAEKLLDENAGRFAAKWGLNGTNGTRVSLQPWRGSPAAHAGTLIGPGSDQKEISRKAAKTAKNKNLFESGQSDVVHVAQVSAEAVPSSSFAALRLGVRSSSLDNIPSIDLGERASVSLTMTSDCEKAKRSRTWCAVRAIPAPTEQAAIRSSTISGCFRSARESAGPIACTNRFCPRCGRANIPVEWTDLTVRHTGYVDQALRSRKLDRDTRILMQELEARPDDPFTLFNLGSIAGERKDWNDALRYLERSLKLSAPSDSIVRKLYALIARAHQMLGESQAAIDTCFEGLKLDPADAELWFRKAVVHRHRGESGEAEECWRRILHCKRPDQFCSVDQGIYGHLTRRNLAALAAERGDHAETEKLWREVLAECPGDREALDHLEMRSVATPIV